MTLQREIRRVKRRARITSWYEWMMEEDHVYRPITAVMLTMTVLISAGIHLLLLATGMSTEAAIGFGLLADAVLLFTCGTLIAALHNMWDEQH